MREACDVRVDKKFEDLSDFSEYSDLLILRHPTITLIKMATLVSDYLYFNTLGLHSYP